jgi:hypothetical protein
MYLSNNPFEIYTRNYPQGARPAKGLESMVRGDAGPLLKDEGRQTRIGDRG